MHAATIDRASSRPFRGPVEGDDESCSSVSAIVAISSPDNAPTNNSSSRQRCCLSPTLVRVLERDASEAPFGLDRFQHLIDDGLRSHRLRGAAMISPRRKRETCRRHVARHASARIRFPATADASAGPRSDSRFVDARSAASDCASSRPAWTAAAMASGSPAFAVSGSAPIMPATPACQTRRLPVAEAARPAFPRSACPPAYGTSAGDPSLTGGAGAASDARRSSMRIAEGLGTESSGYRTSRTGVPPI